MIVASSSGRLDIMGGIADYSGAMVLQMALREKTTVSIAPRTDFICTLSSDGLNATIDYQALLLPERTVDYEFARKYFYENRTIHWTSYVLGCLLVLQKEKGITPTGFDFNIISNVPVGKGVSSSAALEVATMKALSEYYQLNFEGTELPVLAQKVENLIAGAPCGLMDQLASYFGKPNRILPILCQPDTVLDEIILPRNLKFVGIDSDVRHSVGGASYGEVRTAAFMGLKIINAVAQTNESYLANISVADFEQKYAKYIPEKIMGHAFTEQYQSISDTVTKISAETEYNVRQATAHPIYEHTRIQEFRDILTQNEHKNLQAKDFIRLGQLMYQSHHSYSTCGLGSHATDVLVDMTKVQEGKGVYGAKITGGGSGGTVCILCDTDQGIDTVHQIHENYCRQLGKRVVLF
jgi:galactokinase